MGEMSHMERHQFKCCSALPPKKKYVWKANLDEQGRITHLLLCLPGGFKLALDYPTVNNFDFGQLILIALTRRTSLRCLYYCNLEPSSLQKVHSYMRLTTIFWKNQIYVQYFAKMHYQKKKQCCLAFQILP